MEHAKGTDQQSGWFRTMLSGDPEVAGESMSPRVRPSGRFQNYQSRPASRCVFPDRDPCTGIVGRSNRYSAVDSPETGMVSDGALKGFSGSCRPRDERR